MLERAGASDVTILEQRWLFERGWRLKKAETSLVIPFGKTYFLKPLRGRRVILPWYIKGSQFSLFDSCHIPHVMSSYRYSARSGEVSLQLYNTSKHEAVISSKTGAVTVVSRDGFDIRHLNDHRPRRQGKTQHVQDLESELFNVEYWASRYPRLFSSVKPPTTDKMKDLSIHEKDFRIHGELKTEYGASFDVMKMVGDDVADKAIQEYLDAGFFEPVPAQQWVYKSPVMFLSKDHGKRTRLVNDYRKLNTYFEVPPGDLVSIGRVLRRVPTAWTHFCVLDVANGFFSVPLSPSIRHIFGFSIGTDRYQWCVIPQGWCLSSGLFHERIGRILRGSGALHYVDDVIIGGSSEAEFSANMHGVLRRFEEHGIQVQRRKIRFSSSSIQYLGFDLSPRGRITCSSYVKARKEALLTPVSTIRDLQSKLGVFNLLRRHIPHLATKLSPLTEYLKRKMPFDASRVTDLVKEIWLQILGELCALQLVTPSVTRFHLYTDWSTRGCGYALFFEDAEGRMCLTDLNSVSMPEMSSSSSFLGELWTAKFSLEATRHLVGFRPVTLYSDNKALVERLSRFEDNHGDVRVTRLHSWIVSNVPQLRHKFVPGEHNELADLLSRMRPPASSNAIQEMSDSQKEIIDRVHSQGHFGVGKTCTHLQREGHRWPKMHQHVQDWIRRCPHCQRFSGKRFHDTIHGKLPTRVNQFVFMDVAGPYPLPHGRTTRHILVLVDAFSRLMRATVLSQPTSSVVVEALRDWDQEFGRPEAVQTDNASYFTSKEMSEWLASRSIEHVRSSTYEAHSNGMVERAIGGLKLRLRKLGVASSSSWTKNVTSAVNLINDSVHRISGYSPNELMFGCQRTGELVSKETLQEWRRKAVENTRKSQTYEERRFRKRHPIDNPLEVGDLVMWKMSPNHRSPKPFSTFWDGPYECVARESRFIWDIKHRQTGRLIQRVHTHQLRRYYDRD